MRSSTHLIRADDSAVARKYHTIFCARVALLAVRARVKMRHYQILIFTHGQ